MFYKMCNDLTPSYLSSLVDLHQFHLHWFVRNSKWAASGENCLQTCAKCADLDHPAHAQSIIKAALYSNFEGPDQTASMRKLIWAFAVRIYPKKRVRMLQSKYVDDIIDHKKYFRNKSETCQQQSAH